MLAESMFFVEGRLGVQAELPTDSSVAMERVRVVGVMGGVARCLGAGGVGVTGDMFTLDWIRLGVFPAQAHCRYLLRGRYTKLVLTRRKRKRKLKGIRIRGGLYRNSFSRTTLEDRRQTECQDTRLLELVGLKYT